MSGRKPAAIDENEERHTGIARSNNVIQVATESNQGTHSAPFPRALAEFFLKAFSDARDIAFDPFLGSGTTMAAAQVLGRIGYGAGDKSGGSERRFYCELIRRADNRFDAHLARLKKDWEKS